VKFAVDVGTQLGLVPDEDQRDILEAIYAVDGSGRPACFEVAIVAPRQNLKTATLEIAALTDLYVFEEPLHIWTAHKYDAAQRTYLHMRRLIEENPDYASRTKFHDATGDQAIELLPGGQRIEFHARSKGAGRSAAASKVTLDEALYLQPGDVGSLLPTLATLPDAQVRYGSSAGLITSAVLRGIRNRGREGGADGLGYFEWCAPVVACGQEFCPHVPATPGCALDRVDLLQVANPAYGRRITAKRLAQFRKAMPPEEFAREFFGWWDDPPEEGGAAIPADDWRACLDPASAYGGSGHVALGVHLSGDRSTAYVAAVGERSDGLAHAEILDVIAPHRAVGVIKERWGRHRCPVVLDPGSHAGSLAEPLEREGVTVDTVSVQKIAQACGMVIDAVTSKTLRHIGQPPLDAAVAAAGVRTISRDAWAWSGQGIAPLSAVTLAMWGYATGDRTSAYEERGLVTL